MAVKLASNPVADLCIGKPPMRILLPSATTVGDSLAALKRAREPHLAVVSPDSERKVVGKICVSDVLCFLCADDNLASPDAALQRPITALLPKDAASLVRLVDPKLSVLEALDLILGGAQKLVLPIACHRRKKPHHGEDCRTTSANELCWLTHEDLVRYFVDSISLFSPTPTLSIDALGVVRAGALVIRDDEPGLSLIPLLRHALFDETAVAVVSEDGLLLGEISAGALSAYDKTATMAAGIATLTVGSLVSLIDYRGLPPESVLFTIKERLKEKGLWELLQLMEEEVSSWSSSASTSSASSSDEESGRGRRLKSFFTGRQAAEPEVCHPGSSLVAVMVQALANQVSYLWVVDEEDRGLIGIVTFADMLRVLQEHLHRSF